MYQLRLARHKFSCFSVAKYDSDNQSYWFSSVQQQNAKGEFKIEYKLLFLNSNAAEHFHFAYFSDAKRAIRTAKHFKMQLLPKSSLCHAMISRQHEPLFV